jgi:hypothetical protein
MVLDGALVLKLDACVKLLGLIAAAFTSTIVPEVRGKSK